jgi:ferritin-like metal-binding protein YciE
MLDAERKLVQALGEQAGGASNPQLQKAFTAHQAQTEKQVQRIEQVFEQLGEQAEETKCKGLKGLLEEVESFKEENPSEDILDIFSIGAAMKVESYEMNAYESLIRLATEMGHKKAVKLLQQNLKEEESTWKKLESLAKKIRPERTGHEDEEAEGEGQEAQPRRRGGKAA